MKSPITSCVCQKEESTLSLHGKRLPRGSARALDTPSRNPHVRFGLRGRETEPLAKHAAAALARLCNRPIPVIARSPCDEAIQGLRRLTLRRLPRTRFRTILSDFRQSPSGNSHAALALRLHHGQRPQRHALHRRHVEPTAAHPPTPRGPRGGFHAPLSAPAAGCSTRPVNAWMKRSRAKSRSRAARAPRRWP
jgi:hypothetical protein